MPGDMSARATTFSTVVRDGPWMCSAEMHASMRRWRCRAREARSGTLAAELLEASRGRGTFIIAQKLYTRWSLSRKMAHRHLIRANHETARASGPLADHSPAAALSDCLLPHPVRICLQNQPGRDGTPGAALHGHPVAHA